jgi:uncharacterized membrane protein YccF (DUF307 family)
VRLLGNIIWFVFGGFVMGVAWWIAGVVIAITIIGIPFSIAAFRIGLLSFWPFGREVVDRPSRGETRSILELIGNVIWIVLCGLWLALGHLIWAFLLAITVIGIPFALQHVKLAKLSLMPFGKDIVMSPN